MRVQVAAELIERGALDEAELIFREILETTPDHAGAWVGLGKVALQQSRPSEALIYFRTALAHDSKSVPALLEAAGVLSADTALPQAEELYRRVLKQEPDHPGALVGLAHIARLRDSKSLEASTNAFEASVTQAQMLLKRQAGVRSFNESAPFRSAIAPAMKEIPAAEARSPLLHTDVEAGVATSIRTANELAFPARPSVEKCGAHLSVQRASARAPRRLLPGFACGLLCVVAVSTPVSFHLTLGDIWQAGSEALSLQRAKAMFEDAKVRFNAAIQYRAPDPSASTSSIARHFPLGGGDHANSARLNPVAAVLGV
jgi:hypothetical protein